MTVSVTCFGAKAYDVEYFKRLNKPFGFKLNFVEDHLNAETAGDAAGSEVVCIFVNDTCDAATIEKLSAIGVKFIALRCAGFNNVDREAAERAGIRIARVPAYSPNAVAEHALALLMAVNRKTYISAPRTRLGDFSLDGLLGFDLYGKTAGFIGTGKIAKIFMTALHGIGMKLVAFDLYPDNAFAEKYGVEYMSQEEVLRNADVITLHCPLNKHTHHLVNKDTIALMKKGVVLINTGRGGLIDTDALIKGLKSGKIGGAGLDVYENEQDYFFEDKSREVMQDDALARLLSFNNVVVTPHQAFFTVEALTCIAQTTLENIEAYHGKQELVNEVTTKTL